MTKLGRDSRAWFFRSSICDPSGFPGGSDGEESACNAGDLALIPVSGRSPGEETGHSSIPAWRIPWTEEPGRLQSTGSQRVRHNWVTLLSLIPLTGSLALEHPTPVGWPRLSETLLPALLPSPVLSQVSEQHCDLKLSLPPLLPFMGITPKISGTCTSILAVTPDGPQTTSVHDIHTLLYIT